MFLCTPDGVRYDSFLDRFWPYGEAMSQHHHSEPNVGAGQSPTERLARETNTPLEQVTEIYEIETAELERNARIKTFVDVLAIHRTRVLLNSRVAARGG